MVGFKKIAAPIKINRTMHSITPVEIHNTPGGHVANKERVIYNAFVIK